MEFVDLLELTTYWRNLADYDLRVAAAGVPSVLKKVELPIVRNDLCESSLKTTRLGSFFRLHRSFVCAGGEDGVNACQVRAAAFLRVSLPVVLACQFLHSELILLFA